MFINLLYYATAKLVDIGVKFVGQFELPLSLVDATYDMPAGAAAIAQATGPWFSFLPFTIIVTTVVAFFPAWLSMKVLGWMWSTTIKYIPSIG